MWRSYARCAAPTTMRPKQVLEDVRVNCGKLHGSKPTSSPCQRSPSTPADPTQNVTLRSQIIVRKAHRAEPEDPPQVQGREKHITTSYYRSHNHVRLAPSRASTLSRASATVALYRLSVKWLPRPVAIQLRLDEDQGCGAWTRNPSGSTANS